MLKNSVKIEPEEFVDLLKYTNGDVAAIAKFPQYRGKQIIIDGSLSLNGVKDIKNFNKIYHLVKIKGFTLEGAKNFLKSKEEIEYDESNSKNNTANLSEVINKLESIKKKFGNTTRQ